MPGNLVVLAAGVASRMKKPGGQVTDTRLAVDAGTKVKAMIGVGAGYRPFLEYLLFHARQAGYDDIVIVVAEADTTLREYFGKKGRANPFHSLSISYAEQHIPPGREKPPGTADALLCALQLRTDWRGGRFTVCNSDNLYSVRALRALRETREKNALIDYDREALGLTASRAGRFAVLVKDGRGKLLDIVEMPDQKTVDRARDAAGRVGVSMNLYTFSYEVILPFLERVPMHPVRNEKELPAAVRMLLAEQPGSVAALPLAEPVPDLTDRDDLEGVRTLLSALRLEWDET